MSFARKTLVVVKPLMLLTDLGFIFYWLITAFALIPEALLFKDYHNSLLMAWNWSFLPLDILVSATGLSGMHLSRSADPVFAGKGRDLMLLSLSFTLCSGLMALAFWTIRSDFDPLWWAFNGFLLIYPIPALVSLIGREATYRPESERTA